MLYGGSTLSYWFEVLTEWWPHLWLQQDPDSWPISALCYLSGTDCISRCQVLPQLSAGKVSVSPGAQSLQGVLSAFPKES